MVDQTDSIDIVRARSRRRISGRACVFALDEKKRSNICLIRRFCLFVVNGWFTNSSSAGVNIRENRDMFLRLLFVIFLLFVALMLLTAGEATLAATGGRAGRSVNMWKDSRSAVESEWVWFKCDKQFRDSWFTCESRCAFRQRTRPGVWRQIDGWLTERSMLCSVDYMFKFPWDCSKINAQDKKMSNECRVLLLQAASRIIKRR